MLWVLRTRLCGASNSNQRKWLEGEKLLDYLIFSDACNDDDDGGQFRTEIYSAEGIVFPFPIHSGFYCLPVVYSSLSLQIAYCLIFIATSINYSNKKRPPQTQTKSQSQQHKLRPIGRGRSSNKNCSASIVGLVLLFGRHRLRCLN